MSTPVKLVGYLVVLAAVLFGAYAIGSVVGPVG